MTNGDTIRAMSNKELSKFISEAIKNKSRCDYCFYNNYWPDHRCEGECEKGRLEWLESEAE